MALTSKITKAVGLSKPLRLSKFVDSARVTFRGGTGGNGCISMLSLFANELAGPDGGNGGNGGHIVLRANKRVKALNGVAKNYIGKNGTRGMGKCMFGANAEHTFVEVPVGTIVKPAKPKELADYEFDPERSDIVADLDQDGSMFIAAHGGAGGRGNASYLSNANRHPRVAQAGGKGEENTYELWLRIYAHIGLIGLPNAGKSTLLRTLTKAQVKIGNYAFTTMHPQVGVIEFEDFTQMAISDLPGLIEDSHKNRGLGVTFLRHVKRCACLLYVIDLTQDPVYQIKTLFNELDLYREGLSKRPHLVFCNKMDDPRSLDNLPTILDYLTKERPDTRVLTGSTERGDNLEELRYELRRMFIKYSAETADEDGLVW